MGGGKAAPNVWGICERRDGRRGEKLKRIRASAYFTCSRRFAVLRTQWQCFLLDCPHGEKVNVLFCSHFPHDAPVTKPISVGPDQSMCTREVEGGGERDTNTCLSLLSSCKDTSGPHHMSFYPLTVPNSASDIQGSFSTMAKKILTFSLASSPI